MVAQGSLCCAARAYRAGSRQVPELASGEVVKLSHQGQPFQICAMSPEHGGAFMLQLGDAGAAAAAVEVVRDSAGSWYGFRAAEAEGRFLLKPQAHEAAAVLQPQLWHQRAVGAGAGAGGAVGARAPALPPPPLHGARSV
jgi:hypothetical protein